MICGNWKAWHSRMPRQPAILRVQGQCEFPAAGYKAELRRAFRQGVDPAILILDLVIIKPSGVASGGPTRQEIRYEEKTHQHYQQVQIRPDDVVVQVEEVS